MCTWNPVSVRPISSNLFPGCCVGELPGYSATVARGAGVFLLHLGSWLLQVCKEWKTGSLHDGLDGICFKLGWIPAQNRLHSDLEAESWKDVQISYLFGSQK